LKEAFIINLNRSHINHLFYKSPYILLLTYNLVHVTIKVQFILYIKIKIKLHFNDKLS